MPLIVTLQRTYQRALHRMPFEGDETLSPILSKAFMLADDDTINDASIRLQIECGSPRP